MHFRSPQMAQRSDAPDEMPVGLTPPPQSNFSPVSHTTDLGTVQHSAGHCLSAGVQGHESPAWASAGRNGPQA